MSSVAVAPARSQWLQFCQQTRPAVRHSKDAAPRGFPHPPGALGPPTRRLVVPHQTSPRQLRLAGPFSLVNARAHQILRRPISCMAGCPAR